MAGQLIVGLKEGMSPAGVKDASAAAGIVVAEEMETAVLLQFSSEEAVAEAIPSLTSRPEVTFVERNGFMSLPTAAGPPGVSDCGGCDRASRREADALAVSGDTYAGQQWHHNVIRKTATLPTLNSKPPTVAVLDTGADYSHVDLYDRVLLGKNCVADNLSPFDDHGHGTHVAGIIGARASNGHYGEGICHSCYILAIKVLAKDGKGTFFDIAQGMIYARTWIPSSGVPPVKVVHMSMIGDNSALIASEVNNIKNMGLILVAPAGDKNSSTLLQYPGAYPNTAFRVTATNEVDCRAYFSNFSPSTKPSRYNIAAPGYRVYSTLPEGGFGPLSSTIMAAAVVSGSAALVWGQLTTLTRDQLITQLISNGQPVSCGFAAATKRVDVRKAITGTPETTIIGAVRNPFTGTPPPHYKTYTYARLYSGTTLLATGTCNRGGMYGMGGLTAGVLRELRGESLGFITTMMRYPVTIVADKVVGPYMDALPMAQPAGYATIILDWKSTQPYKSTAGCTGSCLGWEFDLLVKTPAGAYIDPRSNPGDLLTAPYVRNPRDSAADLVPMETIVVASSAPDGTYKVFVDKTPYTGKWNPSWDNSMASAQVYSAAAALSGHYSDPPGTCGSKRYWHLRNLVKAGTAYTWVNFNLCTDTKP